jgi:gliding motility-associated-like protein
MKKFYSLILPFAYCFVAMAQTPPHYSHLPANSGVNNVFFNSSICKHFQFIYTQAEIAGMIAPVGSSVTIDTIWFRHGGSSSIPSTVLSNLTIKLGHSTQINPTANFAANYSSTAVTVLSAANYTYTPLTGAWNVPSNNWTAIPLQTPFNYNFTDNLLVEFEFSASSGGIMGHYANNGGSPITQYSASFGSLAATATTARPMLGISEGCALPNINLGPDLQICQGNNTLLFAGNNSNTTYIWNDNSTNDSLLVSSPGLYWVSATNNCGTESDSVNVTTLSAPQPNLGNDTTFCNTGSGLLLVYNVFGNVNYNWSTGSNNNSISVNNPGVYWIDVSNVCGITRDSILIEFQQSPQVNLGPDLQLCDSTQTMLNISGILPNTTYVWGNGSTALPLIVNTNNWYSLTAYNVCGSTQDSIHVEFNNTPSVNAGSDLKICAGDVVQLNGQANGNQYAWSSSAYLNSTTVLNPIANPPLSTYFVLSSSNANCFKRDTVWVIVNPIPIVNAGSDQFASLGEVIQLNATSNLNTNFTWLNPQGFSCISCPNPYFTATETNYFIVQISDSLGCMNTDTVWVYTESDCEIKIPNVFSPNNDGINDYFQIDKACIEEMHVMIYDRWGDFIYESREKNVKWDGLSKGKPVSEGTYYYLIEYTLYNKLQKKTAGYLLLNR